MPAIVFPTWDVLRFALERGVLPADLDRGPVRFAVDARDRVWVTPTAGRAGRETVASLARFGVELRADPPEHGWNEAPSWPLALPLRPAQPSVAGNVLFAVPPAAVAWFAGRLRRAGLARARLCDVTDWCGVVVADPPAEFVRGVTETYPDVEVYREQKPGVWVAIGCEHPLPNLLDIGVGESLILSPAHGLRHIRGLFTGGPSGDLELRYTLRSPERMPTPDPVVPIRFRLAPDADTPAESLWVVDDVEAFCLAAAGMGERLLRAFEIAVAVDGSNNRVVLRPAGGTRNVLAPPVAAGWYADPRVPGLFVPHGRSLRPALRAAEVVRALGLRPGAVGWVEVVDGGVRLHTLPTAAFRPLHAWVVHVAPPPVRLTTPPGIDPFPYAPVPTVRERPLPGPVERAGSRDNFEAEPTRVDRWGRPLGWLGRAVERLSRTVQSMAGDRPEGVARSNGRRPEAMGGRNLLSADALVHGHDGPARRRELEGRLLDDLPALGPDGRAGRWAGLAAAYAAVGNPADAAVCWLNAVWEADDPPRAWVDAWVDAERKAARRPDTDRSLGRWLDDARRPGAARVVAALAVAARDGGTPDAADLGRVVGVLDRQFDDMPARAAWLARLAVTRLCDGDALGLARWRDRVVGRLRDDGPSLDVDEPSFLRFHGTPAAERFATARDWLARARGAVRGWLDRVVRPGPLQAAGLDGERPCTAAYADLLLAWGLGTLGERGRSRQWTDRAAAVLDRAAVASDGAVHAVLLDAFTRRIRDAQDGRAAKPGFAPAVRAKLDALPEFARYAADRLRESSRILDPADRLPAAADREFRPVLGMDLLGERLRLFLGHDDPAAASEEAGQLVALCDREPTSGTVPRVAFALAAVVHRLDGAAVDGLLRLAVPGVEWFEAGLTDDPFRTRQAPRFLARLVTGVLRAAAARSDGGAAAPFVDLLVRRVAAPDRLVRAAVGLAAADVFRGLRALGRRADAEVLLRHLDGGYEPHAASDPASWLGLAVGRLTVGDEDGGTHLLDLARERLYHAGADDAQRTGLAIAYADALADVPPRVALGRVDELFQRLDRLAVHGSTNRYFTLQPLRLIDTVVRAVVGDGVVLNPAVRGWLADDELLIRRRIHRDMAAVLREHGLG